MKTATSAGGFGLVVVMIAVIDSILVSVLWVYLLSNWGRV